MSRDSAIKMEAQSVPAQLPVICLADYLAPEMPATVVVRTMIHRSDYGQHIPNVKTYTVFWSDVMSLSHC